MVIVALHEKTKKGKEQTHIPYRNSMMTSVLRDSLGGNCKTLMIAAVSPESAQIAETISTCQFAQRVALVKNAAYINEELEPELVIARLKGELKRLREEVKFLKGENGEEDELSNEELSDLKQIVESYTSRQDDADLNIGRITLTKVKTVFSIFKELCGSACKDESGVDTQGCNELKERLISLQRTLKQRDEEIKILVKMVKKGEGGDVRQFQNREGTSSNFGEGSSDGGSAIRSNQSMKDKTTVAVVPECTDEEILNDPQKALEWFKKQANIDLDADKALLQNKINTAKSIGAEVKETKANIVHLKDCIDEIQRQVKVQEITGVNSNVDNTSLNDYLEEIDVSKKRYKTSMEELRELKAAIEHIKKLMERKRRKMQSDFDEWYGVVYANLEESKRNDKSESCNEASPTSPSKPMIKLPPGVKLTGNKEADEDIIAFYQAKEALFARTKYKS
jgi:kinesin family protein 6/9